MKFRKILLSVLLVYSGAIVAQNETDVPYYTPPTQQNEVNATPVSSPIGVQNVQVTSGSTSSYNLNSNTGYHAYSPQGGGVNAPNGAANYQVVQQTTEVQSLPPELVQQQQEQTMQNYQQMDAESRFWNVSDKDIASMKKKVEQKQAAIYQDVSPNRCVQREIIVSNAPNEPLPFLSLDTRNKANVMFVDVAGNPWPIHYVVSSNDNSSMVYDEKDPDASLLYANALYDYSQGSFTVKLQDNPVPTVFTFAANQKQIDCLVTVRINKLSPKSKMSQEDYQTQTLDASLNSTLFGVAPKGGRALTTSSTGASAWLTEDGNVIIRTKYKILSPMPKSRIGSPDGTWVYKVTRSSSYLYNYNGKIDSFRVTQ